MMIIIPTADILNNVLKTYVFKKADSYYYKISTPPGCGSEIAKTSSEVKKLSTEECTKLEEKNMKQEKERMIGNKHRSYAQDISFLIVSIPLFLIHQYFARKKEDEK